MKVYYLIDKERFKTPHKPPIQAGTISEMERHLAQEWIKVGIVAAYDGDLGTGQNLFIEQEKAKAEKKRLIEEVAKENPKPKGILAEKGKGKKLIGK